MVVIAIVLNVIAIVADVVTIYMFIESRLEKKANRNEK